jgi:hypothetical protein
MIEIRAAVRTGNYRVPDKSLDRQGTERATVTESSDVHISYLLS